MGESDDNTVVSDGPLVTVILPQGAELKSNDANYVVLAYRGTMLILDKWVVAGRRNSQFHQLN